MPYRLTLEAVECIKETSGIGSDEFEICAVTALIPAVDGGTEDPLPEDKATTRWSVDDVDSGELKRADVVFYDGELAGRLFVAYLALEVDSQRRANTAFDKFEADSTNVVLRSRWGQNRQSRVRRAIGYLVLIAAGAASGNVWAFLAAVAIAILVEVGIAIFRGRFPDTLIHHRMTYDADSFFGILGLIWNDANAPLPRPDDIISTYGAAFRLPDDVSFARTSEGNLREFRTYSGMDNAKYKLHLVHEIY